MSNGQTQSYTLWERLDPNSRNEDLTGALRMELGDPLWLLSRQHQFGEFEGEDAGSPTRAEVEYRQDRTSRVRLGPEEGAEQGGSANRHSVVRDYNPETAPSLETLIEREPVAAQASEGPPLRLRIEAGMNFLDRLRRKIENLDGSDQPALPVPNDFPERFYPSDPELSNEAGRRFSGVFQSGRDDTQKGPPRALDGHEVYLLLKDVPGLLNGEPRWDMLGGNKKLPVPRGDDYRELWRSLLTEVAPAFVSWYRNLYDEPEKKQDTWNAARLEYEAAASMGTENTEIVFEIEEYSGGRLDWYDFVPGSETDTLYDAETNGSSDRTLTKSGTINELPTQMKFRGQPASRLWEMEDADVNLSTISAAENDLARLFLLEYTLLSGDNWYSLPLDVPVGSLTRIANLEITDTFGRTTTVQPPGQHSGADDWSMFTFELPDPSVETSPFEEEPSVPGLYLPSVLGDSFSTDPVERVQFARDQMANLLFGIEERFEGPLGTPIDRSIFSLPQLKITELHPASDPDDEYIEFTNQGDDRLHVGNLVVSVKPLGSDDSSEEIDFGSRQFIGKGETIRIYTGGSTDLDTSDRIHAGRGESMLTTREESETVLRTASLSVYEKTEDDKRLLLREPVKEEGSSGLDRYRIASDVADQWFPFTLQDQQFHLALLLDTSVQSGSIEALPQPRGRILDPSVPIKEEEVTRSGVRVDRTYQLARSIGGRRHVWTGRNVELGTGEESSSLRFDFLVPSGEEGE